MTLHLLPPQDHFVAREALETNFKHLKGVIEAKSIPYQLIYNFDETAAQPSVSFRSKRPLTSFVPLPKELRGKITIYKPKGARDVLVPIPLLANLPHVSMCPTICADGSHLRTYGPPTVFAFVAFMPPQLPHPRPCHHQHRCRIDAC
jgi:hypothetical protein